MTLICKNGHKNVWSSQPIIEGMAAGNLLLSSSTLLSGSTYTKVASLADIPKLKILSERTFYSIKDTFSQFVNQNFKILGRRLYSPRLRDIAFLYVAEVIFLIFH